MFRISSIITTVLFTFGIAISSLGQAPNNFKYQSIARNAAGYVMSNAQVGLRISIRDISPVGSVVFQETHIVTTNEFGLFTLSIGDGTPVSGTIQGVPWASGSKFIEIEADLTGGTNYLPFGTTQLLSVPYALYANTAGTAFLPPGTATGNTTFWNGSEWVVDDNNLFHDGARLGVGISTPLQRLHVNGNVNIGKDSSYMIDNQRLIWVKGNNIFFGYNTGDAMTAGISNTFFGYDAGPLNSIGSQNTFLGTETGMDNVNGNMGTFVGNRAGYSNTLGNENTFIGAYAGQFNTDGQHNSFLGVTAGSTNSSGSENTFLGAHAGYFNTTGSYNTLVGNFSGENSGDGNYNTTLGFEADFTSGALVNAMALGSGAVVSSSNTVVIGNTSVISIGGQVGWSTLSDGRLKENIRPNQLGLDFINRLNTVNYTYKTKGQEGLRYSGLIAQDVESVLEELGLDFSGIVRPANNESYYSIRYSEFVVPLIKAVQEQSNEIQQLNQRISELEQIVNELIEKK